MVIYNRFIVIMTAVFAVILLPLALQAQSSGVPAGPPENAAQASTEAEALAQQLKGFHREGKEKLVLFVRQLLQETPASAFQALEHVSWPLRALVADTLGGTAVSGNMEQQLFNRLAADPHLVVRGTAAASLHRITANWAFRLLVDYLLTDPDQPVRENAAWSLMQHRTPAAREALWKAFASEKEAPTKAHFAGSLADMGDERVLAYLLVKITSDLPFEKGQALRGILGLQREGILQGERLLSVLPPDSLETRDLVIVYPGEAAIPELRKRLVKEDGSVELMVLGQLAVRNDAETVRSIVPLFEQTDDPDRRRQIAQFLPLLPPATIAEKVETWIQDSDPWVRIPAAVVLSKIDPAAAEVVLLNEWENATSTGKRSLGAVLAKLGIPTP